MKNKFTLCVLCFLSLGCSRQENSDSSQQNSYRIQVVESRSIPGNNGINWGQSIIFRDTETNQEFLVISKDYGSIAITPIIQQEQP